MSINMTVTERNELETLITEITEAAVSDEYARSLLESENDGKTLMEDIVQNVLETSAWADEHCYNDSDIRYAIGRELLRRMGEPV